MTGKRDIKDIVIYAIKNSTHYAKEGTRKRQNTRLHVTKQAKDSPQRKIRMETTKTSSRSTALVLHYLTTSRPHRKGEPTLPT